APTRRTPGSCGPKCRSPRRPRRRGGGGGGAGVARRTIVVDGQTWEVHPSGRVTVYDKDEFGLMFQLGTGAERKRRFTRYAPVGSRRPDAALAELSTAQLIELFRHSQPAWTAPEAAYGAG